MADLAQSNFKEATKWAKTIEEIIAEYLSFLAQYIEDNGKYAPQKEMAKWIRKGGDIYAYTVRGDCQDELKYNLSKCKIPFISMSDGRIVVPGYALEQVKDLNREINVSHCNYYQEVNAKEMEDSIARFSGIKDKDLLKLEGIDPYFVEVLKNKSNDISKGFMIGTEKDENGDFSVTILGTNVYSEDKKKDFCKAYLQAAISLYGPNQDKKIMQIDADNLLDKQVEELKNDPDVHYIVGVDEKDVKNIIELNGKNFQHYISSLDKEGNRVDRLVAQCEINDPSYDEELQICLDKIKNKTLVDDINKLNEHISTNTRNLSTSRPEKSKEEYLISICYDRACDTIDSMIREKIASNDIHFSNSLEAFSFYQKESGMILEALSNDKTPEGYSKEIFNGLKESFSKDIGSMVSELSSKKEPITLTPKDVLDSCLVISDKVTDVKVSHHIARTFDKEVVKEAIKEHGIVNR